MNLFANIICVFIVMVIIALVFKFWYEKIAQNEQLKIAVKALAEIDDYQGMYIDNATDVAHDALAKIQDIKKSF